LPIFEFLVLDQAMREKLITGSGEAELRALSRKSGYGSLLDNGVKKMLAGLTTAEEVLSVTFAEDIGASRAEWQEATPEPVGATA
jgi:general secretion pathway protein E/type IV pilus assembly protein PilB